VETKPGSAQTAASRFSNAAARVTSAPPRLHPVSAMRLVSTSGRVCRKSMVGMMTFSQSGRNEIFRSNSIKPWPGPSKISAFQPRSIAAAPPKAYTSTFWASLPFMTITVGRRPPCFDARK
jgi:hypothetical protein